MFNTDNEILQNDVPLPQTDLQPEPEVQSPSHWRITSEQAGGRLDRYLPSQLPALSRTLAQQMIAEGIVLVNNKTSKAGYILRVDDDVLLLRPLPTSQQKNVQPQSLPLVIVHEDNDLLVINKAAGMVVH